ncbi:helix-turn-helix domain-containing protein [Candidatus Frankia alpina]|uniref:Helix-turn-helix domain-containing protein n=1 Tax=Candidatus Frankia alpina TaxID=2699483 RepID=A0A4S5EIA3_9ACTN|nr:helix-turn-helix domain-containing protein [Candidatus Frankia alpina]THJ71583.1 helix-turn-helix domain-containing protein [Candidatus Frankia alpina]
MTDSAMVNPAGDPLAGLKPLISVETAAEILGFSRAAAYRYTKSGALPCRRVGGRVYVITAALRVLLTPDVPPAVTE